MYRIRSADYDRRDQARRWALPDRVFFACGACHILAHVFLERYGEAGDEAVWIRPDPGRPGNHIVVARSGWIFDHHGYAPRDRYLAHTWRRARRLWPGWDATLVPLPWDVLISEAKSRAFDGLHLREPTQFLHDALPRARRFLDRFPEPRGAASSGATPSDPAVRTAARR